MQYTPEIAEMIHRMFRLRKRFRVGLPDNLALLKKHIRASHLAGKVEDINDFDLFYSIGIIFSRRSEPMTMGELSHDLEVPLSTATRIMDWMVSNGYAQRSPDPEDRRVVRVALTEAGQAIYRMINEFFMERIGRFFGYLTPMECETFLSLLRKVLDGLEKEA